MNVLNKIELTEDELKYLKDFEERENKKVMKRIGKFVNILSLQDFSNGIMIPDTSSEEFSFGPRFNNDQKKKKTIQDRILDYIVKMSDLSIKNFYLPFHEKPPQGFFSKFISDVKIEKNKILEKKRV